MSDFKFKVDEAMYKAMLKANSGVIDEVKRLLKSGKTAKQIERVLRHRFGTGNLTAMAAICAAYHMEKHPELPEAQS